MAGPTPPIPADRWSRWWNRISQVSGLAIIFYEVIGYGEHASFVVLLFASAMMLGAAGLRILIRGATAIVDPSQPAVPQERDEPPDP